MLWFKARLLCLSIDDIQTKHDILIVKWRILVPSLYWFGGYKDNFLRFVIFPGFHNYENTVERRYNAT